MGGDSGSEAVTAGGSALSIGAAGGGGVSTGPPTGEPIGATTSSADPDVAPNGPSCGGGVSDGAGSDSIDGSFITDCLMICCRMISCRVIFAWVICSLGDLLMRSQDPDGVPIGHRSGRSDVIEWLRSEPGSPCRRPTRPGDGHTVRSSRTPDRAPSCGVRHRRSSIVASSTRTGVRAGPPNAGGGAHRSAAPHPFGCSTWNVALLSPRRCVEPSAVDRAPTDGAWSSSGSGADHGRTRRLAPGRVSTVRLPATAPRRRVSR